MQPDAATVQGTLASAIGRITGEKVLPQGSGRTDAGVHALAQVMTFVTESSVPTENFLKALNDILPASVRVLEVRRSAAGVSCAALGPGQDLSLSHLSGSDLSAVSGAIVWHYPYPLDERSDGAAASWWWGRKTSLRLRRWIRSADEGEPVSNVRTIFSRLGSSEGRIDLRGRGSGFLHHMVRNLVGTFILVGKGTFAGKRYGANPRRADTFRGRCDCAGEWVVPCQRRILRVHRRGLLSDGGSSSRRKGLSETSFQFRGRSRPSRAHPH